MGAEVIFTSYAKGTVTVCGESTSVSKTEKGGRE
jgi:hypothetical protein